ncbi:transposase [Streptomyces misionensis]|uniref:transposase n=1 Tax=Streptomyces misionensis TaxID=67331 RepID=UPI0036FA59C6
MTRSVDSCPAGRKNGRQPAEYAGHRTPDRFQRLLNGARWDADELRDDFPALRSRTAWRNRRDSHPRPHRLPQEGHPLAGVRRSYSGTAGRTENCQIGVFAAYATTRGRALVNRELYVLAYDLRNMGLSGAANDGAVTSGLLEGRDILGSLRYAANRSDTKNTAVAPFSRCLGTNSTFAALHQDPKASKGTACLVACRPVSDRVIMGRMDIFGVGEGPDRRPRPTGQDKHLDGFPGTSRHRMARYVRIPTYLYGVHGDPLTVLEQAFEVLDVEGKKLARDQGTSAHWDGYPEFQRRPEAILEWLTRHLR